jgi:uncharacterized membrane protein
MAEQKRRRPSSKRGSSSGDGSGAKEVAEVTAATDDAGDEAVGTARGAGEEAPPPVSDQPQTVTSELKKVVREAAIEALSPAARNATAAAAKYALTKGPGLVSDKVAPRVTGAVGDAGGPLELAKKAGGGAGALLSQLRGGKGDAPAGTGRGRRLPIQVSIDVAVPLETAYNQFTQFEEFPEFMHRVDRVEQTDDTHLMWHENIWGVRRQWEAEITEQRPNERIVWESTNGSPKQKGVVTFHDLSDRLTRIEVTLDQQPKGIFEKASSGFRLTRRALRSDLMRFKAFIETSGEETGAWRDEIEAGEVVGEDEERAEPDETEEVTETRARRRRGKRSEPETEAEEAVEPELEDDEAEEDEEVSEEDETGAEAEAAEDDEESEEEEKPKRKPARRRSTPRRRSPAGRSRR